MDGVTNCLVSGALATFLRVSRFAGIAPLRFVHNNTGWRVSLSTRWTIYGYLIITFINVMSIGTLIFELQQQQSKSTWMRSNIGGAVSILRLVLLMLTSSVAVYGAPGQMRCIIKCLNRVQKINRELRTHHWPRFSEKKKTVLVCLWMIACFANSCIDYGLLMLTSDITGGKKWIYGMYWFYFSSYWIVQLRIMLFIMITLHVMDTFKAVNHNLRGVLNDDTTKTALHQRKMVRRLSLAYASACDLVREVDQHNGFIALMILGIFQLHLLVSAYYVTTTIILGVNISMNTAMHVMLIVIQLSWCIFHLFNMVIAIEPCHLTHTEMEITRELVSKLIYSSQSAFMPLDMELDLFFRHLLLNQTSYSPLKVTTMSRSLVAASVSIITTYLVVIIQL